MKRIAITLLATLLLAAATLSWLQARPSLRPVRLAPESATNSAGKLSSGPTGNIYTNPNFSFSFRYAKTFDLLEQYPATWPPTTAPSFAAPYIITLSPHGSRYALFELDVLPKSAWNQTRNAIKDRLTPYSSFVSSIELLPHDQRLSLDGGTLYQPEGDYQPFLYYFQHPSAPYIFTFNFVQPPTGQLDWQRFYDIIGSIRFTTP